LKHDYESLGDIIEGWMLGKQQEEENGYTNAIGRHQQDLRWIEIWRQKLGTGVCGVRLS